MDLILSVSKDEYAQTPLHLVHDFPADNGQRRGYVAEGILGAGERIIGQNREVGKLAYFDAAFLLLLEGQPGAFRGGAAERLFPGQALAWYAASFGGTVGKLKDRIDGVAYSGVWVLVAKGEAAPSAGHAIDHLGFQPVNVDAAIAALKAKDSGKAAGLAESPARGAVAASDAFFPFADGLEAAVAAGATAMIQPGGCNT